MQIEGQYTVPASPERVWAILLDPEGLRQCLPGCERMEAIGENEYAATLKIGVAAVRGTYHGKVLLKDLVAPSSYTMVVEGSGSPGFVRGTGTLEFEEQGGNTLVKLHGKAEVGGLIAGVGQRMLGGAAKMVMGQFFTRLSGLLDTKEPATDSKQGIGHRLLKGIKGIAVHQDVPPEVEVPRQ